METPYKNQVFQFGLTPKCNPPHQSSPTMPDIMQLLSPSFLAVFADSKNTLTSPALEYSLANTILEDTTPEKSQTTPNHGIHKQTRRRLRLSAGHTPSPHKPRYSEDPLTKLQHNPMFNDLTKLLAEECHHMQVPTNLMNITWDHKITTTSNVHIGHLKLQKRFLQFRSDDRLPTKVREIECRYSKEVNTMEVARYLEISSSNNSSEQTLAVHDRFDYCRLQLISDTNRSMDALEQQIKEHHHELSFTSNDSSYNTDYSSSTQYSDIDVLGLAMAAADVHPSHINVKQHLNTMRSKHIPSLLETFDLPRHDFIQSQVDVSPPINVQSAQNTQRPTPSLKRKFEDEQSFVDYRQQKKSKPESFAQRRQITTEATTVLTIWYENHLSYPYPTDEEVETLTILTSLSTQQVKKWMANKRVRCFNTLSITGNTHPIKAKLAGKKKNIDITKQLTEKSRVVLNNWYQHHIEKPYPSEQEKKMLALEARITIAQVKSWFANKRSRANNRKRQVPNYFLEKFPEYAPHVQLVQEQRDQSRRKCRLQPVAFLPEHAMINNENSYW
ncbi:homeobox protein 3-like [Mytilus trossulus]|uniref:homeobox protein 3-like n=1 Tax=Mytilus trossulus TaxID=6551 RepID=UPI003004AAB5